MSTACSKSQWALPDLNRERQISVPNCNRQIWALPDFNREYQISVGNAATARSQWAQPDMRAPDLSGHCRFLGVGASQL